MRTREGARSRGGCTPLAAPPWQNSATPRTRPSAGCASRRGLSTDESPWGRRGPPAGRRSTCGAQRIPGPNHSGGAIGVALLDWAPPEPSPGVLMPSLTSLVGVATAGYSVALVAAPRILITPCRLEDSTDTRILTLGIGVRDAAI